MRGIRLLVILVSGAGLLLSMASIALYRETAHVARPSHPIAKADGTWLEDRQASICDEPGTAAAAYRCGSQRESYYAEEVVQARNAAIAQAEERERKIDAAIETFKPTRFYYNKPRTLRYRKASTITLAVASADQKRAKRFVSSGVGPVISVVQPLGKEVTATLEGPPDQVDIRLRGEEDSRSATLPVSAAGNAEWAWYVTPKTLDDVTLTLTLTSQVRIDGEDRPFGKETYEDRFTIQASWFDRLKVFIGAHWDRLFAAVAAFAALFTAIFHMPSRSRTREKTPEPAPPAEPAPVAPPVPVTKPKTRAPKRKKTVKPTGDI